MEQMPFVDPATTGIDYKLQVIAPDPNIDYKLGIVFGATTGPSPE